MLNALTSLLFRKDKRNDILGIQDVEPPTKEQLYTDSAKLIRYANSDDYKVWEEETWARALNHLDVILNDLTPPQKIEYHRGALKATLDLLRLSHEGRKMHKAIHEEIQTNGSSAR
jgi:hypothetical protein